MKVLVVCLLAAVALGEAAPSDILPGDDYAAVKPQAGVVASTDAAALPKDSPAQTPEAVSSASSASVASTAVEKASENSAAPAGEKTDAVAGVSPPVVPAVDGEKIKTDGSHDKADFTLEPVVEAAEPSGVSGHEIPANSPPVKKVPVYVPVEYAGAYDPDNFFNPAPVTSTLSGYIASPSAVYPYRSVVRPWYQLLSPDVPILTLYPDNSDSIYRGTGMACDDPLLRYIHGANPMVYTGPAAASPYAANHFAAAALSGQHYGGNPNPYGTHVPYYRFPFAPETFATTDYSRSNLVRPTSRVSPVSSRLASSISPFYIYPDAPSADQYARRASALAHLYTGNRREYAAEPDRRQIISI